MHIDSGQSEGDQVDGENPEETLWDQLQMISTSGMCKSLLQSRPHPHSFRSFGGAPLALRGTYGETFDDI